MLYFAWLSAHDDAFDPVAHAAEDETVLSLRIFEREEGDIIVPGFEVEIPNPGIIGLLASSNRYAVISEQNANDITPVELARGRLTGVPTELAADVVRLEFLCVPPDEDDVLNAAADALRVGEAFNYDPENDEATNSDAEAYDPVFVGESGLDDPSTALSGRPEVFRWDRKALTISRTHIINGGSTVDIGSSALEGSVRMSLLDPPKKVTKLRLVADFTQRAKGTSTLPLGSGYIDFATYTFEDFLGGLPAAGTSIGDSNTGWSVGEIACEDQGVGLAPDDFTVDSADYGDANGATVSLNFKNLRLILRPAFDYEQQREEILDISAFADVQDVLGDDRTETVETIRLAPLNIDSSTPEWLYEDPDTLEPIDYFVDDEVIANGKAWVCVLDHTATTTFMTHDYEGGSGDQLWASRAKRAPRPDSRSPKYFDTDRGIRSVRHAFRRLKREILLRSRALELEFECSWNLARDLTCDDAVRLEYRHLAGGEATGKVTSIELEAQSGGTRIARVRIGVSIGNGNAAGTPGAGESQTDDIIYTFDPAAPSTPVNAYALSGPLVSYTLINPMPDQKVAGLLSDDPISTISAMPTRIEIVAPILREEDLLTRRMTASCAPIPVPQGINLSAT